MELVWNLFFMFGGVAVMMYGMKVMGDSLEKCAGGKMKTLLGKATSNRFAGVGVGTAVTAVIQSSTATTVMLVGFVNIGLMTLTQATNVIMGANIGTTVTAHIASLAGIGSIDIGAICALIGMLGIFVSMLVKNETVATIGSILGGLGLIFVGLEVISSYAKDVMLVDGMPVPFVQTILMQDHFPLLLVLIGIVLTAIVHSSSTVTSLMVALCSVVTSTGAPLLSLQNALFLTLGSNIGTCITAIIVGLSASTNAKRTGLVHFLFNTIGCLIFLAPIWIWSDDIVRILNSISAGPGQALAIFHTVFNVITTLCLIGFTKYIVKLACLIIPDKKNKEEEDKLCVKFIDQRLLKTPQIAAENTKSEIIRMAGFAKENINLSVAMLLDDKVDNESAIRENESVINFLNRGLTKYITDVMSKDLSETSEKTVGTYYHVVSDIERVGDYAENIMEYSFRLRKEGMSFSEHAKEELSGVLAKINELFDLSMSVFENVSYENYDRAMEIEESIDVDSEQLENKHIDRVRRNACTAELGSIYLQTVSNLERVADHITNVAKSIKSYKSR